MICLSSNAQKLIQSTFGIGGVSKMISGKYYSDVVGQSSVSGSFTKGNIKIRQGFKQPGVFVASKTQPVSTIKSGPSKNPEGNISIKAFPNPFVDRVTLSLSDIIDLPTQIILYDLTGNIIFEKSYPNLVKEISIDNLDNLRAGQYILHFVQHGNSTTMILVKQL
jgi:hypothetical protein